MKKFLFFTCLAVVMVGCDGGKEKEKVEKTTVNSSKERVNRDECSNNPLIRAYYNEPIANRPAWLRQHSDEMCDESLAACIEDAHIIVTETLFNQYANAHIDNSHGIYYYQIPWQQLNDFIGNVKCYEKYIGFDFEDLDDDGDMDMAFKMVNFTTKQSCYSINLFKALNTLYNLNGKTIYFTKAMIDVTYPTGTKKEERIIFKIEISPGHFNFIDITNDPTFVEPYMPL